MKPSHSFLKYYENITYLEANRLRNSIFKTIEQRTIFSRSEMLDENVLSRPLTDKCTALNYLGTSQVLRERSELFSLACAKLIFHYFVITL